MTIRHIVMWKLATADEPERSEQAARIKAGLEALPPVVPEILALEVGVSALPGDDFDVVLVSDFADTEALQRYADAPAHREVAGYIRSVVAGRACVDVEV